MTPTVWHCFNQMPVYEHNGLWPITKQLHHLHTHYRIHSAGIQGDKQPWEALTWTSWWTLDSDLWPLDFPSHLQTPDRHPTPTTYRPRCPGDHRRSLCWRWPGGAHDQSAGRGRSPQSDSLERSRGVRQSSWDYPRSFTAETLVGWKGSQLTQHSDISTAYISL